MNTIGPIKSTVYLWLSIIGFTLVGYGIVALTIKPALFQMWPEIEFSGLMGSFFGTGFWAMSFDPDKVADNVGWRKWRPLMWWCFIFGLLWTICFSRHTDLFSLDTLLTTSFMTSMVLAIGWFFGHTRADRARRIKNLENQKPSATMAQQSEIKKDGAIPAAGGKMEVTLRKANALSKALLEASRARTATNSVAVSIYAPTTVEAEVATGTTKLMSVAATVTSLIEAAYSIRDSIAMSNASNGVDSLLTEKAKLDTIEKFLAPLAGTKSYDDDDDAVEASTVAYQARLDALKERAKTTTDRYNRDETITVTIAAPAIAEQLASIRRRKIAIADELLILNMTKKVTLPEKTATLLTELKLV
jgi:hypothetical protein